jgi:hypothetical protein
MTRTLNELNDMIRNLMIERDQIGDRNAAVDSLVRYINAEEETVNRTFMYVKNIIVTSPTQLGKTRYVIDACKRVQNDRNVIIISCDNSISQLAQLNERLGRENVEHLTLKSTKASEICSVISSGKSIVVTMINNSACIEKLQKLLLGVQVGCTVNKYLLFHDEADTLNKADSIEDIDDNKVAISHRKWMQTVRILENARIPVKRFWISATPENCSNISRITGKDILVLPANVNYRPVSNFVEWDGEDTSSLAQEIDRIKTRRSGEIILYCVEKTNMEQMQTALSISREFGCVTCCHNMSGSSIFRDGNFVETVNRQTSIADVIANHGDISVIVGFNVMNRGISFVSSEICEFPKSATVMFYSGGKGSHVVGIAQRFGRICGTSRPDISRRVIYCSSKVYEDYSGYIHNQSKVWESLSSGGTSTMSEILSGCSGVTSLSRPLDRPALKKVNSDYTWSCSGSSSSSGSVDMDLDKMRRLIKSWKVTTNNTAVAKLFREMVQNGAKLNNQRVLEIMGSGPMSSMTLENYTRKWILVFRKEGRYHHIRDEAIAYYNTL